MAVPLFALFAAALGVAAIAFAADSPGVLIVAVVMMASVIGGAFALGVKAAKQADFVLPYVATLVAALAVAAIGVTAIVVGERGDAPGLVLLGIVLIVSVIVGGLTVGIQRAQRGDQNPT